MSTYEITRLQWSEVIGSAPPYSDGDGDLLVSASWYGARVFCNRLCMAPGRNPAYSIPESTDSAR
jgi:hypothetical protein